MVTSIINVLSEIQVQNTLSPLQITIKIFCLFTGDDL